MLQGLAIDRVLDKGLNKMMYFILSSVFMIALGLFVWALIARYTLRLSTVLRVWLLFWRLWPISFAIAFAIYTLLHVINYAREPEVWLILTGVCILGYINVLALTAMVHSTMMKMYKRQEVLKETHDVELLMHHLHIAGCLHRLVCRMRHIDLHDVIMQVAHQAK